MARRLLTAVAWATSHSRLAGDWRYRPWMFLVLLSLPVKRRLLPGLRIPLRLRLGRRPAWFWFGDASELIALEEIFNEGEYAVAGGGSPRVIVDLGANIGQAALWFRSRFPDARLLCVEADPRTFTTLRRNVGGDPLVTLCEAAVTSADGPVRIERTPGSSWGTRVAASPSAQRQVRGISLETLLDDHDLERVDLLKVDIEGLEHDVLGASPALRRAALVVGEIHAPLLRVPVETALEDMRTSGGFDRCELRGDIFVLSRGEERTAVQT